MEGLTLIGFFVAMTIILAVVLLQLLANIFMAVDPSAAF